MSFFHHLFLIVMVGSSALPSPAGEAETTIDFDLDAPEHQYWSRPLNDPFTSIKNDLESGALKIDSGSEKEYLEELLNILDVPLASQTLVFSTTSLQLRLISPQSPRAIYFNEEIYVGYVPGGRIEIISIDPNLGAIFYIFDIPGQGHPHVMERSRRCMNCHSDEDSRNVPGLVIKSVIPGPRGGSLDSYRRHETGHQIPLRERFGGWYVTGGEPGENHWGNLTGQFTPEGIVTTPVNPGESFNWSKFPVQTSDILPHLLHEHQAGFINRVVEAHYRARSYAKEGNETLSSPLPPEMEKLADSLVRYLLYKDEAELPSGGIKGDENFKREFLTNRITARNGESLKDFDLRTRMFRYRCSYMIYSSLYQNLPPFFRTLVSDRCKEALSTESPNPDFSYLSLEEKKSVRKILRETHPDFAGK